MTRHDDHAVPHRAEVGYTFPPEVVRVTREEQQRLHGWCDIAPALFGDVADPTFVGRPPILLNTATIRASRPGWGPVHLVQRLCQYRAIALDEALTLHGRVTALSPHPRGTVLESRWEYRDAGGALACVVEPEVLMLDPQARPAARTPAVSPDPRAWQTLQRHVCTPETTLGYCAGSSNQIHFDPDYARGFGLRAPIIAGMQTVNFLVAPCYRERAPTVFAFVVSFLRPVFWDDTVDIAGCRDGNGVLIAVRAVNGAGKVVATLDVTAPRAA